MKNVITRRVLDEAKWMIETEHTIRDIAKRYQVSKSTVHKDLQERLRKIDTSLYQLVSLILNKHIHQRHLRGGESTRRKYLHLKLDI